MNNDIKTLYWDVIKNLPKVYLSNIDKGKYYINENGYLFVQEAGGNEYDNIFKQCGQLFDPEYDLD